MIRSAKIQFAWDQYRPPQRLSVGFFFKPVLTRFRPLYWTTGHWPLVHPVSEAAKLVLATIENQITPPDTILPKFADQIVGDRDEFFGFLSPPESIPRFNSERFAAAQRDEKDWEQRFGKLSAANVTRYHAQVVKYIQKNGSQIDRFFDAFPVEFALMTNDSAWWISTRQSSAIDELKTYASSIKGMRFRESVCFGL